MQSLLENRFTRLLSLLSWLVSVVLNSHLSTGYYLVWRPLLDVPREFWTYLVEEGEKFECLESDAVSRTSPQHNKESLSLREKASSWQKEIITLWGSFLWPQNGWQYRPVTQGNLIPVQLVGTCVTVLVGNFFLDIETPGGFKAIQAAPNKGFPEASFDAW